MATVISVTQNGVKMIYRRSRGCGKRWPSVRRSVI